MGVHKVTVREIIEMLSKCDWDDECTCITKHTNEEANTSLDIEHFKHSIIGISQTAGAGTHIIFDEQN